MRNFLLISAFCFTACATAVEKEPVNSKPIEEIQIEKVQVPVLAGTKWRDTPPSKMTLRFTYMPKNPSSKTAADGNYSMGGQGDCNSAGSEYIQDGWKLKASGPVIATLMGCENMQEDARLVHAMENVQSFTIDNKNRLILMDKNTQRLLVLERDLSASP